MVKFSSNFYKVREEFDVVEIGTGIVYYDFNVGVNYVKGDEDFVEILVKIKPLWDLDNYYYLCYYNKDVNSLEKVSYILNSSVNVVFKVDGLAQYKELVLEVRYSGLGKKGRSGDVGIYVFTRSY